MVFSMSMSAEQASRTTKWQFTIARQRKGISNPGQVAAEGCLARSSRRCPSTPRRQFRPDDLSRHRRRHRRRDNFTLLPAFSPTAADRPSHDSSLRPGINPRPPLLPLFHPLSSQGTLGFGSALPNCPARTGILGDQWAARSAIPPPSCL